MNPMTHIKLCGFADEADANRSGQIKALTENAIPYLEIRGVDGTNIADLSREAALQFKSELDAAGIKVWSIGSPAGKTQISGDFEQDIARFKHLLDMAEIFEAKRIRLFSFYGTDGEDSYFEEVCRRLNVFCGLCEERGVIPCHENEKGIYGENAPRCLAIHKAIPRLKAVFDPANFVQCDQDTLEAWEMLHPYITYMHIKDSLYDGTVVLPGTGDGNVPEIIGKYVAQGGKLFTLEPHLSDFVGLSDLEQANNKSLVGHMTFATPEAAFDAAAQNLVKILNNL